KSNICIFVRKWEIMVSLFGGLTQKYYLQP
ncbi:hypothetical protein EVA_10485, partial [gut metagenome]